MPSLINMTGWVMKEHNVPDSRLTVLEYDTKKKNGYWIVKCECGKVFSTSGIHIRRGETKSCGCLQKEKATKTIRNYSKIRCNQPAINRANLIGQRFGMIQVLAYDDNASKLHNRGYWKCKCDCGKIFSIAGSSLVREISKSCGCNRKSNGELKISNILNNHNITFKSEYTFNDLKYLMPLRFDFAIFKNNQLWCLVEYQGIGHYQEVKYFSTSLQDRQYHDNLKRLYCKENNIKLIEIPYYDLTRLDWNYLQSKCEL